MNRSVLSYLRQYFSVFLLGCIFVYQVVEFTKLSLIDFDGHHDGYILASAIGVSEGRLLYRDVFWQYGPLQPYILAGLIKAAPFFSPLMVARLTGVALTFLIFLLVLLQPSVRKQKLNEVVAIKLILMILFLALQDSNYGVPFLFWPNLFLAVFLALSINGLIKQIQNPNEFKKSSLFYLGLNLILISLTRTQFLAITSIILILILFQLRSKDQGNGIKFVLLGFNAPLLIVGLLMAKYHMLQDFFEQTFTWPREAYDSQLIANFFQILRDVVINNFLLVGLLVALVFDLILKRLNSFFKTILFALLTVQSMYEICYGEFSIWTSAVVYPARIPIVILEVVFLIVIALCASYIFYQALIWVAGTKNNYRASLSHYLVVTLAVLSLSQAFPVFDTRHTYWAVIGLLPLLAVNVLNAQRKYQYLYNFFSIVLILAVFSEIGKTSSAYEGLARVEGEERFVDGGIWTLAPNDSVSISTRRSSSLGKEFQFLEAEFSGDEQAIFLSKDASFSIFDGSWRSVDRWFVNWGPAPVLSSRIKANNYPLIVLDNLTASASERKQIYFSGYSQVDQMGRLSIFRIQQP